MGGRKGFLLGLFALLSSLPFLLSTGRNGLNANRESWRSIGQERVKASCSMSTTGNERV